MLSLSSSGNFGNMDRFLRRMASLDIPSYLNEAGREGVDLLGKATPVDTHLAARSWVYKVGRDNVVNWDNKDVEGGFPVAIMLQYGYSTGTGGYVPGRDFINPVTLVVADKMANNIWKAVTSA